MVVASRAWYETVITTMAQRLTVGVTVGLFGLGFAVLIAAEAIASTGLPRTNETIAQSVEHLPSPIVQLGGSGQLSTATSAALFDMTIGSQHNDLYGRTFDTSTGVNGHRRA